MKTLQKITLSIVLITLLSSCSIFKGNSESKYAKDPVCGMKVLKSEALTYKYENQTIYFDKDNCKQTFIMNPKKFFIPTKQK